MVEKAVCRSVESAQIGPVKLGPDAGATNSLWQFY